MKQLVRSLFNFYKQTSLYHACYSFTPSKEEYYSYISSDSEDLVRVIADIQLHKIETENKKFLDVGCGMPIIPSIMHLVLQCDASGLEYNQSVVDLVKSMASTEPFNHNGYPDKEIYLAPLFQGNLLTFDYKDYDILYSYHPIRDKELMMEGVKRIIDTMKMDAVFYFQCTMKTDTQKLRDLGFNCIEPNNRHWIYKFIKK